MPSIMGWCRRFSIVMGEIIHLDEAELFEGGM